ncbi:MAG: ATP-binding protein [Candidatus Saccharibacteria bacterium]|nr:ATP-binding protein [Candidatus Saccharibacteria bacterium]
MSVEAVDFGAVALTAAVRDLTAPLVLLRQLSFQLEQQSDLQAMDSPAERALQQMRLTIGRTFNIAEQLRLAVSEVGQLSLEPVQLVGLCQDLRTELRPLEQELHCQLDFELPRRSSVVAVGNYEALKIVMIGFLTDALHYQASEKPAIGNAKSDEFDTDRIVRLRVAANNHGEATMAIYDRALGINLAQSLRSISNLADDNPTRNRPLMGSLNLVLADRLLRAMNGRLTIHNHRQGGMTIETSLPMSCQLSLIRGL